MRCNCIFIASTNAALTQPKFINSRLIAKKRVVQFVPVGIRIIETGYNYIPRLTIFYLT